MPTDDTAPILPSEDAAFGPPPAFGTPPSATATGASPEPEVDTGSDKPADTVPATEESGSTPWTPLEIGGAVVAVIVVVAVLISATFSNDRSNDTLGNKRISVSQQDDRYVEPDPMTVSEIDVTSLTAGWATDGLPLTQEQVGTAQDLTGFRGTSRDHYHRWTPQDITDQPPTVLVYTRTPEGSPVNRPLQDDEIVLVVVSVNDKHVATFDPSALDPIVLEDPAGFAAAVKGAVKGVKPGDQVVIDIEKFGGEVMVYLETSSAVKQAEATAAEAKFKAEQDRLLNQIASSAKPNEALVEKLIKSAVAAEAAKELGPTDLYVVHAYGSNLEPTAPNGTPLPEWLFGEHGDFLISHDPDRESDYSIPIWFDLGRG